jgi:hypothetical protein
MPLRMIAYGIRALFFVSRDLGLLETNTTSNSAPTVNVTCPSCSKVNVFSECGHVVCLYCGWGMVIDEYGLVVRGQANKFKCSKCSDLLEYNNIDTRCYCYKCDIMYTRKGSSLVANCYVCSGTGETGFLNKTTCSKCNGAKKLAVSIG